MIPTATILALALGYLLGSVPFGLLITRAAGLGDVRNIGSGNIGATNVLRTGNKGLAALTLLCDALKGTAAVLIGAQWGLEAGLAAGFAAFLGHLFPVWLSFKGGKGVATYLGILIAFAWQGLLAFAITWLATAVISRYSSLSALVACIVTPVVIYMVGLPTHSLIVAAMSIIIFIKHRPNIERLLAGTESKIGSKG